MKNLRNSIRKKYAGLRGFLFPTEGQPKRLIIEKARWRNNADSPVILMIDDLANAWHSAHGRSMWDPGGDWGGGLSQRDSVFRFLTGHLLKVYPEVKITFFAVAGKTSHYTHGRPFSFAEPLNVGEEAKNFFRGLNEDDRFEIAYHGFNHGMPGEKTGDFAQEWEAFRSIDEACEQIRKGTEIFKEVFGREPSGGKYGGWKYNAFADASIDRSGFLWWCRDWTPRDTQNIVVDAYYEPQFFGENLVVALPSTIHGFFWTRKQIDTLLKKRQIISIEEHIAPLRPDGVVQAPNIIDDMTELRRLFAYLRGRNVWYATASEVAEYFIAYSHSILYDITDRGFRMRYDGRVQAPEITLRIDSSAVCTAAKPYIRITLPDGSTAAPERFHYDPTSYRHLVNLPLQNGEYRVKESAAPSAA